MKDQELFLKYQETKDVELRNRIVEDFIYLAEILAKKYVGKGVDYDDLFQVASLGLVHAVERFDASKGFEFASFATPTIIGDIKRYFRDKTWAVKVPRRVKEISAQVYNMKETLTNELHRPPTVQEIANRLEISDEDVLLGLEGGQNFTTFSLQGSFDSDSDEEEGGAAFEKFSGIEEAGFETFENADLIRSVMKDLDSNEKAIFKMRFLENQTQAEVGEALGMSQMTISRIEKRMREKFIQEYHKV
ncbi:MAG: SigB/SigF/SigG family RNA polymerase sigma factor [Clostridiales Family XIII bacterium]|jgi:RNA polymerase sigma-B factor|nr:SigB/SigF/SigG family RNA polymerase sigma factor [Clostridiales Family XIII bacterium]